MCYVLNIISIVCTIFLQQIKIFNKDINTKVYKFICDDCFNCNINETTQDLIIKLKNIKQIAVIKNNIQLLYSF